MPHLSISHVSRQAGLQPSAIRYYERIGLMPKPPRSGGGHRVYDATHVKRLGFIRRARELGFSLDEVRDLLGLARGHSLTCADVKALTEQHIAGIKRKVADLRRLERVLGQLAAQCHGNRVPDCPILEALAAGSSSRSRLEGGG